MSTNGQPVVELNCNIDTWKRTASRLQEALDEPDLENPDLLLSELLGHMNMTVKVYEEVGNGRRRVASAS
jgi:hypothetical protein